MDDLIFDTICEVQVKFKILYICSSASGEQKTLIENTKLIRERLLLKILSLTSLKEVLTGKFRNRVVLNYFKKLACRRTAPSALKNSILFLDSTYLSSIGVSSIYSNLI